MGGDSSDVAKNFEVGGFDEGYFDAAIKGGGAQAIVREAAKRKGKELKMRLVDLLDEGDPDIERVLFRLFEKVLARRGYNINVDVLTNESGSLLEVGDVVLTKSNANFN